MPMDLFQDVKMKEATTNSFDLTDMLVLAKIEFLTISYAKI